MINSISVGVVKKNTSGSGGQSVVHLEKPWTNIVHNLPASFINVTLRYKISKNRYILDFKWDYDGTGNATTNNFEIAVLPDIDSSLLVALSLNDYANSITTRAIGNPRLLSSGNENEDVKLIGDLLLTIASLESNSIRASMPITKLTNPPIIVLSDWDDSSSWNDTEIWND